MRRGRAVLAGLGVVLVGAGVVFAIVDLGAADQVASVAGFLLAAVLGGMALLDRRSRNRDDRTAGGAPVDEAPAGAGSPRATPAGAGAEPDGGAPPESAPAAGHPPIVAGAGSRVAVNSDVVFQGPVKRAKVRIDHGTRHPWWRFWS